MLYSFPQFIIYNLPLKKLVPILDITLVKATLGISQMAKLGLQRNQYVKNPVRCFNGKEWICYSRSSLVNFLYQCQSQYIKQQKLVSSIYCFFILCFIYNFIYNIIKTLIVCLISHKIAAIEIKQEPKTEKKEMKPPPEKKPRLN